MRRSADRLSLLHKVAVMFYRDGMAKDQIGKRINKTSTHVKNLLEEAKAQGIVSIKVELPRLQLLQAQLERTFPHLREVIVIPHEKDTVLLVRNLAQAAADYFEANVIDGVNVGLGGGYVIHEMVNLIPERKRDIHIYPGAIVARGTTITHIDPMILVTLLWAKSGHVPGRAHYMTVTPPDKSSRLDVHRYYRRLRENNERLRDLLESMKTVDWLFASTGGLNADEDYVAATQSRNLLDEMKFDDTELRAEGVVGDVVYSYFDERGNTRPTWELVISIGVKQLRKMAADSKKRVVIVVGNYKMQALRAVLVGQLCNVVITDALAAQRILAD